MDATAAASKPAGLKATIDQFLVERQSVLDVLFPLFPLAFFAWTVRDVFSRKWIEVHQGWLALSVVWLIALAFSWVKSSDLTPASRVVLRTLTVLFAFYFSAYSPTVVPLTTHAAEFLTLFNSSRVLTLFACALALWRPSFSIVVFSLMFWQADWLKEIRWVPASATDMMVVLEFGTVLIIGLLMLQVFQRVSAGIGLTRRSTDEAVDFLLLALTACHFANYFFSGMRKVLLDGGPLSWLLENQTSYTLLANLLTGHVPFVPPDWALPTFLHVAHTPAANIILNTFVLGTQLAAIFAIWRIWTMRVTCLVYDVQHIGIWLVTGIFFWKWIILNSALAYALRFIDEKFLTWWRGIALAGYLLAANLFFSVAWLGWYETGSFTWSRILAITEDGKAYRVPTNYFGGASGRFYQGDYNWLSAPGFATRTVGTTKHYEIMRKGNNCLLPVADRPRGRWDEQQLRGLNNFFLAHHLYVLQNAHADGRINYDIFPHHIWSNIFKFDEFRRLDKTKIQKYRFVISSDCMSVGDQGVQTRRVGDEKVIEVPLPKTHDEAVKMMRQ